MNSKALVLLVVFAGAAALLSASCTPKYPKCENDTHCKVEGKNEFCVNALCQACRDNSHCGACEQCSAGRCTEIAGCCQDDSACGQGQKCRNGRCGSECVNNEECGGGKVICQAGRCVPVACLGAADCPAGQQCVNNACLDVKAQCSVDTIYFDFDEAALTSSSQETLKASADCIKQKDMGKVTIEGHADERGTDEYNLSLGQKRATAARNYLQRLGVKATLKTVSFGEHRPAVQGQDEGAWSRNRRAEFVGE